MHAGAIDDLATNLVTEMKVELGNNGLIACERAVKRLWPKKFRMTQEPLIGRVGLLIHPLKYTAGIGPSVLNSVFAAKQPRRVSQLPRRVSRT